ncbi:ATP-binding protein [Maridesulfovibrio frigidus]|uniref:ATP-binding protein n=1 Tax=Maridesulfovibrio frigidus TaxID=340956 RepID=UPI0004E1015F|nr:ATP-binding protein [Maridesulfovibrio frigidus]
MSSKNNIIISIILCSLFLSNHVFAAAHDSESIEKKSYNVLCLNQGISLTHWKLQMFTSCKVELTKLLGATVNLHIENISTKALQDIDLRQLLYKRYNGKVDFILTRRKVSSLKMIQKTFPGIPVIVTNLDKADESQIEQSPENIYTTITRICPTRTAKAMVRMLPHANRIIVIAGSDSFAEGLITHAKEEMKARLKGVNIEYWIGIPLADLLKRVHNLPTGNMILFLTMARDSINEHYTSNDVVMKIGAVAKVPVFGIASSYFQGNSIVGGYIDSATIVGGRAARSMASIAKGTPPPHVAELKNYGQYQFEWRQLQRWNISEDLLPVNSVIFNKPNSFFDLHPTAKYILASILTGALILIIAFIVYWKKRSVFINTITEKEKRYRSLFESSHLSLWEEDMSGLVPIIKRLKDKGVTNWIDFFEKHPEELQHCAEAVKIVDINKATLVLHEAESKEELFDNLAKTFSKRSWEVFGLEVASLAQGKRHLMVDGEIKTLTGKTLGILVYIDVLAGYEETLERVIVTIVDRTEKRNLEKELSQAQKLEAIGSLAAGVAHEINTPLQYINVNLSFISEAITEIKDLNDHESSLLVQEIHEAAKDSIAGTNNINAIVKAMKRLAHPSQGEIQTTDFNELIQTVIMLTQNEWKFHADVNFEPSEDLMMITCIPSKLSQVILNLIVNASHAIEASFKETSTKGIIDIKTYEESQYIVCEISDTGCGMSDDVLKNIFDPFYTTKEIGMGTGQGLSIALSIVNHHKGSLNVQSEIGSGTTFTIRLPVEPSEV